MTDPRNNNKDGFIFLGRDLSKIPCFRNSFMAGIGGGIGVGIAAFFKTSNSRASTNYGFGAYMCITVMYWVYCRHRWSKMELEQKEFKKAIQMKLLMEGTQMEKEFEEQTKDV